MKVVRYNSLMINVPFNGVLTYCGAIGELSTEASAVTPIVLGKARLNYI